MNGTEISVSEALTWQKTLRERYQELVGLRAQNANRERIFYGTNQDKERVTEPLYDVRALDRTISGLAREMRLLDEAIKRSNAKTPLANYLRNDAILGELEAPATKS